VRIVVEKGKCTGHARCNAVAPEVYPLDDDGYNALTEGEVRAGQEQHARDGAAACPERAITVTE
jgi:ferredoxin